MESTERLSLPLIIPGQAQKELFHNEALLKLDAIVAAAVEEPPRNDPPVTPVAGTCYLVGQNPGGEWAQYAQHIAAFTSAGWRFIAPAVGMSVQVKAAGTIALFGSAGWEIGTVSAARVMVDGVQVIGSRAAAVPDPAAGAVVDAEARAAITQILSALRQHGLISS